MEWYLTPPGLIRGAFLRRTVGLMAGRGCPYRCIFCGSNAMFGRSVRLRSVENVMGEIHEMVQRHAIDGFYFYDDTFTIRPDYVLEFCQALRRDGLRLKWGCQAAVNTVRRDVLEQMKASGCVQVDLGVESGSPSVLKTLKKGTTPERVRRAFTLIREVGIRAMATFVVGSPGESLDDIEQTRQLARAIRPDYVRFFYLTPFPGSELYQQAVENQWIDPDVEFLPEWQIRQSDNPVMTIHFTKRELQAIRARLQNGFFWRNYLTMLRDWPFALLMLGVLTKHPRRPVRELGRTLRTRRLDNLVELALDLYRNAKAKELTKRRLSGVS